MKGELFGYENSHDNGTPPYLQEEKAVNWGGKDYPDYEECVGDEGGDNMQN